MSQIQTVRLSEVENGIYPTSIAFREHEFSQVLAECPHCKVFESCITHIGNQRTNIPFDTLGNLRDLIMDVCPCVLHRCYYCKEKFLISFENI